MDRQKHWSVPGFRDRSRCNRPILPTEGWRR